MAINWTEAQIEEIVASVMKGLTGNAPATRDEYDGAGYNGKKFVGVYTEACAFSLIAILVFSSLNSALCRSFLNTKKGCCS